MHYHPSKRSKNITVETSFVTAHAGGDTFPERGEGNPLGHLLPFIPGDTVV